MAEGWFPIIWFLLKTLVFIFFFVWLRGVLPRMRYDAFMRFGWKVLIPVGLVWILLVAGIRTAALEVDDRRTLLLVLGSLFAVVVVALFLAPAPEEDEPVPGTDVTPLSEGGFPTPPMDLAVPPTPRSLARSAVTAAPSRTTPDTPTTPGGADPQDEVDRG
jgi:NADH-quinone oxidoreductase subunit H